MSVFAPGTGGDLKSTTVPAALLEMAGLAQSEELAIAADVRPDNVSITYDAETQVATITATVPATFAVDSTGKIVLTATDYLP